MKEGKWSLPFQSLLQSTTKRTLPELAGSAVMDSTGEPWELILIDDGSQDGSTET
jgi:glycosyltransferase involved in cell wall biosynthesis